MRPKIREDAREHRQDGWSFSCHKERCTAKVGTLAVTDGHRPRRRRSPARTRRTLRGYPVAPALSGARSVIMLLWPPTGPRLPTLASRPSAGSATCGHSSNPARSRHRRRLPPAAGRHRSLSAGNPAARCSVERPDVRQAEMTFSCLTCGVTPVAPSSGRRSARQRVRAGRGHEPLRHPVVDVMYPSSNRPVSSSTDALSEVLQIRAAFAASATAPSRELCASIRLSPGSS